MIQTEIADHTDTGLPSEVPEGCSEFGMWAAWSDVDREGKRVLLAVSHSKTRLERLLTQRMEAIQAWRTDPNWGNIYSPYQYVQHEWIEEVRFI